MNKVLTVVVVGLLAGLDCVGQKTQPLPLHPCASADGGFSGNGGGIQALVVVTGETHTETMRTAVVLSCDGSTVMPSGVDVSVIGPDDRPVMSHASDVSIEGGGDYRVDITFTPTVPGPYHVTASFAPTLGQVQADVWVSRDMTHQAAAFTAVGPGICERAQVTAHGTLICGRNQSVGDVDGGLAVHDTIEVVHASGVTETWPDLPFFAVSQDTVWTWSSTHVVQLHDTGADQFEVAGNCISDAGYFVLLARPTQLLVSSGWSLLRLSLDGGACQVETLVPDAGLVTAVASNDQELLLARADASVAALFSDGGTSFDPGISGTPVASGRDGLWLEDGAGVTLRTFDGRSISTQLPVGWVPSGVFDLNSSNGTLNDVPMLSTGFDPSLTSMCVLNDSQLELQQWSQGPSIMISNTADFVTLRRYDGSGDYAFTFIRR